MGNIDNCSHFKPIAESVATLNFRQPKSCYTSSFVCRKPNHFSLTLMARTLLALLLQQLNVRMRILHLKDLNCRRLFDIFIQYVCIKKVMKSDISRNNTSFFILQNSHNTHCLHVTFDFIANVKMKIKSPNGTIKIQVLFPCNIFVFCH